MSFDGRLKKFLLQDDGIEKIFKVLGWITATAVIYKIIPLMIKDSVTVVILTVAIWIVLISLAIYYGLEKIVEPFTEALFGEKGTYSRITTKWGFKARIKASCSFQSLVSLLLSVAFLGIAVKWFDAIIKLTSK